MKCTATGKAIVEASITEVTLSVIIRANGLRMGDCEGILARSVNNIRDEYNKDITALNTQMLSCQHIDIDGSMIIDFCCSFTIPTKGNTVVNDISEFICTCSNVPDVVKVTGWSVGVDEKTRLNATANAIDEACEQALFEAKCLCASLGKSNMSILSCSVRGMDIEELPYSTVLPDSYDGAREEILASLEDLVPKSISVDRSVVLTVEVN